MHLVIAGNPVDGFRCFGPFPHAHHAADWAVEWIHDTWWVTSLEHPESLKDSA